MQKQARERATGGLDKAGGRVQITYRPISELKLDPKNPRAHRPRQVRQIARSIERFGFVVPVLTEPVER